MAQLILLIIILLLLIMLGKILLAIIVGIFWLIVFIVGLALAIYALYWVGRLIKWLWQNLLKHALFTITGFIVGWVISPVLEKVETKLDERRARKLRAKAQAELDAQSKEFWRKRADEWNTGAKEVEPNQWMTK